MIDLNRPKAEKKHEPDTVEIIALIVVTIVWIGMILGAMI